VALEWNGQKQIQQVSGGSGFAAQNDRRLHFGLGKDPVIANAVIRWPSGKIQTLQTIVPGQLYKLKEPL
jgi:enediyne biosynthesis protein E4